MSKVRPATPSTNGGKATERTPSRNPPPMPPTLPTLKQLKYNIENAPGVVKNAEDTRNYLKQQQWSLPKQKITCSHLVMVLLSLVSIQGPRKTLDKFPDATANTIKAVAYLLEEAVVTQYVDQIKDQVASATPNTDTPTQIKEKR